MPTQVLNHGIASYNRWVFNNTTVTEAFSVRPVWDSAGRTIVHSVFSVTLSTVIAGLPGDREVLTAITLLTQPAAGFVYTGRGVGNVRINLPGGVKDTLWGPKPRMLDAKMYGRGKATRLTWQVEFAVPTCAGARYEGPMEFAYSSNETVDRSGYTQRSYVGFVRIANTRPALTERRVFRSADEWREAINPPLLFGFRRCARTFKVSEDKCRLDFDVRDEQMGPNAPPRRIVEAEASHSYSLAGPGQVLKWVGLLEATYEVALNENVNNATGAFAGLARGRLREFEARNADPDRNVTARAKITVVPLNFTVADTKIYDRTTVHMSMQYTAAPATLGEILERGGLWNPTPGGRWDVWAATMRGPFSSRGFAQLKWRPGRDDSIVDLCGPIPRIIRERDPPETTETELRTQPKKQPQTRPATLTGGAGYPGGGGPGGDDFLADVFPRPTAERSWLEYEMTARFEIDQGTVVGRTLPTAPLPDQSRNPGTFDPARGLPRGATANPFPAFPGRSTGEVFVHQRAVPVCYVTLVGYAVRAGYPIPVPELDGVNGSPAIACNRPDSEFFEQKIIGNVFYPVYAAKWRLRFVVPRPPKGPLPVPVNPLRS